MQAAPDAHEFPIISREHGKSREETGSQTTAYTATKSSKCKWFRLLVVPSAFHAAVSGLTRARRSLPNSESGTALSGMGFSRLFLSAIPAWFGCTTAFASEGLDRCASGHPRHRSRE